MNLTNDDVQEILRLLDSSFFDELYLETDRFKLSLRRSGGAHGGWTQENETLVKSRLLSRGGATAAAAPPPAPKERGPSAEGGIAILPPMMGTFYRAPKPGASPFVEVGTAVKAGDVVGIIETMKLMNPVHADAEGVVVEICAADGQFVEADHVLIRLEKRAP